MKKKNSNTPQISNERNPEIKKMEKTLGFLRNKRKRSELARDLMDAKREDKKKRRMKRKKLEEELGDKAPPKQVPNTLDNTREPDVTFIKEDDDEIFEDIEADEFTSYFNRETTPKTLITTNQGIDYKIAEHFCKTELAYLIPNSSYYKRRNYHLKEIIQYCKNRDFTDIIVINEDNKQINGLLLIHLPDGPTALFKLSSIKYKKDIQFKAGSTDAMPELILNNFDTRLGTTIGRMIAALFPHDPNFKGRRVITFHNQRDFVFVRQHRYTFDSNEKVRIQEIGPRFTLKLRSLQHGTFDSKYGEFEWIRKKELTTSRRVFFL
eukprot:TRINITY_DN14756_c0_g1_i1.p1 TRINITY_DN14756_c0_g1~~TRINITY_DN14756_c0_g1_i1.p1  ORF type:complete len:322 (-),score=45.80 TRINITY_DN14756_c0_g1_i1:61-1026(-)